MGEMRLKISEKLAADLNITQPEMGIQNISIYKTKKKKLLIVSTKKLAFLKKKCAEYIHF